MFVPVIYRRISIFPYILNLFFHMGHSAGVEKLNLLSGNICANPTFVKYYISIIETTYSNTHIFDNNNKWLTNSFYIVLTRSECPSHRPCSKIIHKSNPYSWNITMQLNVLINQLLRFWYTAPSSGNVNCICVNKQERSLHISNARS